MAAVKAIAELFRGLPVSKEDGEEIETSTLGKYFTFFTRLLTRAKSDVRTLPNMKLLIDLRLSLITNRGLMVIYSPIRHDRRQI